MRITILESVMFDIVLTQHLNYKREKSFRLCYGLQVTIYNDIVEAIKEFNHCVQHALNCEGLI